MESIRFSTTTYDSKNIVYEGNEKNFKSKIFISAAAMVFVTTTATASFLKPSNPISRNSNVENILSINSSNTKPNKKNFSNNSSITDIMKLDNRKLEVEDLMEKVTQAQLDEIKAHFDTKIEHLDKTFKDRLSSTKKEIVFELKEHISSENDKIKENKTNKFQFVIGSVIVPIITVAATLFFTKFFHIF